MDIRDGQIVMLPLQTYSMPVLWQVFGQGSMQGSISQAIYKAHRLLHADTCGCACKDKTKGDSMTHFEIIWNDGYVVQVYNRDTRGYMRYYPLRKFHEQGDAKIYRDEDCPKMSNIQIRWLIKQYKPEVQYKRINNRRFVTWDKWISGQYI